MMGRLGKSVDFAKFLFRQRVLGFDPPGDEPWMDDLGKARFAELAARSCHFIEYGSGGSTVVADRLGLKTISVDSDRFYAKAVASKLQGCSVRQVWADVGITHLWGNPVRPSPQKGQIYVEAPFQPEHFSHFEPSAFPDLILVDGRYRAACALNCAAKANDLGVKATLLFDDYLNRDHYTIVEKWLGSPRMSGRVAEFCIGASAISSDAIAIALDDQR